MPTFSADDANLFCTGQNPDDMLQEINVEMENLFQGESKSHYGEKIAKFMLCSWTSAERRSSNYIWVIIDLIVFYGAAYIRGLTVY